MGMRKIIPSNSAAFSKAFSSSSSTLLGKLSHSNPKSFVPNPHSLHQFLTQQCKFGAITLDQALHVFDYMIRMLPPPPVSSFNHLLGALAKIQHHDHFISFYQRLNSVGVFPNIRTLDILLNCCCKMGLTSDGFLVLGKILRGGYCPTTSTFNTLIKGLCMDDKIGEATKLFKNMSVFGCQPDIVTYSVIDGLCKHGKVEKPKQLFSQIKDRGISPDVVVYTSLLHGCCFMGNLEEGKGLFIVMVDGGVQPNMVTSTVLIDGLCKQQRLQEANELLDLMLQIGSIPTWLLTPH